MGRLLNASRCALRRLTVGSLLAATTLGVAISLLPLAARYSWTAELASHFRLQYFAGLALLLVPLLLLRYRWWSAIVVAAMAVNFAPMAGYWLDMLTPTETAHAGETPSNAVRLKVMTANVQVSGHPPGALIEIVRSERPDIIVLPEFTPRWARRLAPLDELYPHHYKMPQWNAWGLAVLSRYEIESAGRLELPGSRAVEVRLRLPGGKTVTVIGVHLRSPTAPVHAAARNRQLVELAAHRKTIDGPLIVTGDFNITPYSPYFRDWLAATGLKDARRGFGLDMSWPAHLPVLGIPIDHFAVSSDFIVTEHRTLPAFGSDHYPMLAELVLP